jgi:hypothetical protein
MKFIKKFNESVEDTKNWIYNVMDTCKDIMIELEDNGMETEVKRSLQPDKSVIIECIIKSNKRWKKDGLLDSKNRLVDYMELVGFELVDSQWFSSGYQYKISFKKSDIDNDYIAHLRYLKKYNIKESFENKHTTEEIEWIEDSLLELTDDNFICKVSNFDVWGNYGLKVVIQSDKVGKLLPIQVGDNLLTIDSYLRERGWLGYDSYNWDNPDSPYRGITKVKASLKGIENKYENELSDFIKMLGRFTVNAPFDEISVYYFKMK